MSDPWRIEVIPGKGGKQIVYCSLHGQIDPYDLDQFAIQLSSTVRGINTSQLVIVSHAKPGFSYTGRHGTSIMHSFTQLRRIVRGSLVFIVGINSSILGEMMVPIIGRIFDFQTNKVRNLEDLAERLVRIGVIEEKENLLNQLVAS